MKEYSKHLEFYQKYGQSSYSILVPEDKWGNKKQAEKYLKKYWLPEDEYQQYWKPIQQKVFPEEGTFPKVSFSPKFQLLAIRGGCLFAEDDFTNLQLAIQKIYGEKEFVIIQSSQGFKFDEPMFKMKFPVNITWEELISGNYISAVLFEMMYNEFYVFSGSGNWGKYAANDYKYPVDIIGFKPEYSSVFENYFIESDDEKIEIHNWLPPKYKKLVSLPKI